MERKIGEIFKYNGEWYQCVESRNCGECSLFTTRCGSGTKNDLADKIFGKECSKEKRSDNRPVIFKKLEKVGEPYDFQKRTFQTYKLHTIPFLSEDVELVAIPSKDNNTIEIEIKQNEEDMEENKIPLPKEDNHLTKTVYNYVNGKISDKELIKSIKEMSDEYPYNKNNLKPFDIEAAKDGKPVCTRDGRKARIICYDRQSDHGFPLVALVENPGAEKDEDVRCYRLNGVTADPGDTLMMLPEKKEGWVNVYNTNRAYYYVEGKVFKTKDEAMQEAKYEIEIGQIKEEEYTSTIKVEWEE